MCFFCLCVCVMSYPLTSAILLALAVAVAYAGGMAELNLITHQSHSILVSLRSFSGALALDITFLIYCARAPLWFRLRPRADQQLHHYLWSWLQPKLQWYCVYFAMHSWRCAQRRLDRCATHMPTNRPVGRQRQRIPLPKYECQRRLAFFSSCKCLY